MKIFSLFLTHYIRNCVFSATFFSVFIINILHCTCNQEQTTSILPAQDAYIYIYGDYILLIYLSDYVFLPTKINKQI